MRSTPQGCPLSPILVHLGNWSFSHEIMNIGYCTETTCFVLFFVRLIKQHQSLCGPMDSKFLWSVQTSYGSLAPSNQCRHSSRADFNSQKLPVTKVIIPPCRGQTPREKGTCVEFLVCGWPLGQDHSYPHIWGVHLHAKSGIWRMGADMNRALRVWKASSAIEVHQKGTLEEVRAVRGAAKVL